MAAICSCIDPNSSVLNQSNKWINSHVFTSITSLIPNFGQKKRVKMSYSDPGGAGAVTIRPLPAHFCISSKFGCKSTTSFPEESSTYQVKFNSLCQWNLFQYTITSLSETAIKHKIHSTTPKKGGYKPSIKFPENLLLLYIKHDRF